MKPLAILGTAGLVLLLGATVPVWAQQEKQNEAQSKPDKPGKQDKAKGHAKAGKPQPKEADQKAASPAKPGPPQQEAQRLANQRRQAEQQRLVEERKQANEQRQAQHQQQVRLSQARQQQLITLQERRVREYRQRLDQRELLAKQYATRMQQQKRLANYRVQQDYLARMRQQQLALQGSYDYTNDPYFYTAPSYRYSRGGSFYETNQYGADMLRLAVNNGYQEGYRSGQADQQDRWASDYRTSYAYQDANYGYTGYSVNQADYNYYFRQGFNRGYQDGYNTRTQYGQYANGSGSMLANILSQILNLRSMP